MISHKYRAILIHIPRTAGTSIEHALVGVDWWGIDANTKHIYASVARELYAKWWSSYVTFTVIREEEERIQSFVNRFDSRPEPASNYLNMTLDHYLAFEDIQVDWAAFARQIGAPTKLPHIR